MVPIKNDTLRCCSDGTRTVGLVSLAVHLEHAKVREEKPVIMTPSSTSSKAFLQVVSHSRSVVTLRVEVTWKGREGTKMRKRDKGVN